MPIYGYRCGVCGAEQEVRQPWDVAAPLCCGESMSRTPSYPAMVMWKGDGGYPSRRRFLHGSAPFTGRGPGSVKPWLSYDPFDETIKPMQSKAQA